MPKSIAIIGASADRIKFGNKAVRAYIQQGWTVYPVNPREETIEGLPVYRSVLDIPGDVDLATFYLLPQVGINVVADLGRKRIPKLLLNPGTESEELIDKARQHGLEVESG